jgi:hypothetical protein
MQSSRHSDRSVGPLSTSVASIATNALFSSSVVPAMLRILNRIYDLYPNQRA